MHGDPAVQFVAVGGQDAGFFAVREEQHRQFGTVGAAAGFFADAAQFVGGCRGAGLVRFVFAGKAVEEVVAQGFVRVMVAGDGDGALGAAVVVGVEVAVEGDVADAADLFFEGFAHAAIGRGHEPQAAVAVAFDFFQGEFGGRCGKLAVACFFAGFGGRVVGAFCGGCGVGGVGEAFGGGKRVAAFAADVERIRHGDDVRLEDVAAVFADVEDFVVAAFEADFVDVAGEGDGGDGVDVFDHRRGVAPVFQRGEQRFLYVFRRRRGLEVGGGGEMAGEEDE